MKTLFETLAILFVLFLVLRVSMTRPRDLLRLRGGLVVLNLLTGALLGCAVALALHDASTAGAATAVAATGILSDPPVAPASAYSDLGAALLQVLPVLGVLLGGLAGHILFGGLWRRYLRLGPAAARAWLRRSQFIACIAAFIFIVHRLAR
jgi:hypothetical protein